MNTRRTYLLMVLSALLALAIAGVASAGQDQRLFVITRSKNTNEVHYVLRLDDRGVVRRDPLQAYWILRDKGGRREELGWMEKKLAYGWEIVSDVKPSGFLLRLVACEKRPLRVARTTAGYRALVSIAGRPAFLQRIHVTTREGGLKPKVMYIELFGTHATTGARVREKLMND